MFKYNFLSYYSLKKYCVIETVSTVKNPKKEPERISDLSNGENSYPLH